MNIESFNFQFKGRRVAITTQFLTRVSGASWIEDAVRTTEIDGCIHFIVTTIHLTDERDLLLLLSVGKEEKVVVIYAF